MELPEEQSPDCCHALNSFPHKHCCASQGWWRLSLLWDWLPSVYTDPWEVFTKKQETMFSSLYCKTVTLIFCQEPVLRREGFILLGVLKHLLWKSTLEIPSLLDSSLVLLYQLEQVFLLWERKTEGSALILISFHMTSQSRTVIPLPCSPIEHLNSATVFTRLHFTTTLCIFEKVMKSQAPKPFFDRGY